MLFRLTMFMNQHFRKLTALSSLTGAAGVGYLIQQGSDIRPWFQLKRSSMVSCDEKVALSKSEFREFKLKEVEKISKNTNLYRFEFDSPDSVSGLVTASCLVAKATIDGKAVSRPYTPTTLNNQTGHLDLLIKTYPAPGGLMSRHIESLKPGVDKLQLKGPFVKLPYKANMKKHIGMIAGGTGITPMYQVAKTILENAEDKTEVSLVFANISEKDVLLRDELDALAYAYPNFKVYYTLDRPPLWGWKMGKGYVSKEMIEQHIPSKDKDVLVMVCGPKGFMEHISGDKTPRKEQGDLSGLLRDMGYSSEQVFKF